MKLLFVRFSSLGDVILTTGVMNYVSRMIPEAQISVLTFSQYAPVFENLPFVHDVISYDKSKGIGEYFYIVQNETEEHDYIFDLHGKIRSLFLRFHSQASYHCYQKDSKARRSYVKNRKISPRLDMHVVQKYAEPAVKALRLPSPSLEDLRPVIIRHKAPQKGYVLLHPFASKNTKAYPYAGELAEMLVKKGLTPVFAGMGKAPQVEGIIDKTGELPLYDMLDTIAACEAVVTTDSGPMHAGVALGRPTVAVFGSTTRHFGFYPDFSGYNRSRSLI
jgi:ADP-heptose:LPS heptosyltransferase